MKITVISDFTFSLSPENETDQALIDALDFARPHLHLEKIERKKSASFPGGYENAEAIISIRHDSERALEAQAGREALGAIRQLTRLFLRELAQDGVVQPSASDP